MNSLNINSLVDSVFQSQLQEIQTQMLKRLWSRMQDTPKETTAQGSSIGPLGNGSVRASAFDEMIEEAARRHQVDAGLVKAVIQVESNFNPEAVSHAGAKGLMQLMDGTADYLGVENSFDARQNIEGGVEYLAQQLELFGDTRLALAAYNAGPGAVQKFDGIPPYEETQHYVKRVLSYYSGDQSRFDASV